MIDISNKKPFHSYNIFWNNDQSLLKFVVNDPKYWETMMRKNIPFINNPIQVFDLDEDDKENYGRDSAIIIPYLSGYKSLFNFGSLKNMSTHDTLILLKDLFQKLELVHQHEIIHGDISASNILINDNLDLKLIDFENGIVDDMISWFNEWFDCKMELSKVKKASKVSDVHESLRLLISALIANDFCHENLIGIDYLEFPREIKSILSACYNDEENIHEDYYFLDILDYLIKTGYESPFRRKRVKF